ncbi:YozE family protein [Eremococcus coleocola]|uniref:YozE family protein n=1 Tax=Eremococcus coleocola TaxID=88132 RepID=UPI00041CE5E0|nr:YozE family protein [Eremococcus coleocola]
MIPSFYEFMMRFVNEEAKDPISRLANAIHDDSSFPKQSQDFQKISNYMEHSLEYSKLISVFDEMWQRYKFDYLD